MKKIEEKKIKKKGREMQVEYKNPMNNNSNLRNLIS